MAKLHPPRQQRWDEAALLAECEHDKRDKYASIRVLIGYSGDDYL